MDAISDNSTSHPLNGIETVECPRRSLPIEVHERIVSFIDVDPGGAAFAHCALIATCALVCRTWLPYSRYKLFHTVRLNTHRQWLCFKQLLLDPPPSIMPYLETTRELIVYGPANGLGISGEKQQMIGFGAGQERPWTHLVVSYCAQRLTGLTRIYIVCIDWTRPWVHNMPFSVCCRYKALACLEIRGCRFESLYQLESLVYAFPALRMLSLSGLSFESMRHMFPSPRAGPQLTQLVMESNYSEQIALGRWLVDICSVRTLSQLTWIGPDGKRAVPAPSEAFDSLVRAIDKPLQVLVCRISDALQADWSRHVDLRKLVFEMTGIEGLDHCLHTFSEVLNRLPSRRLEHLRLWVIGPTLSSLDSLREALDRFKRIDEILARPQFNLLEKMSVYIAMKYTGEEVIVTRESSTSWFAEIPEDVSCGSSLHAPSPEPDTTTGNHPRNMIEGVTYRMIKERLPHIVERGVLSVSVHVSPATIGNILKWLRPTSGIEGLGTLSQAQIPQPG